MEAINYARQARIDVVLVDTAGRMQDNEPLMRALAKLISVNDPDLVLFVGEALVGNEAVDQLVRFNQALADHSPSRDNPHLIDGMVLSKFDTIDDKVIQSTHCKGSTVTYTESRTPMMNWDSRFLCHFSTEMAEIWSPGTSFQDVWTCKISALYLFYFKSYETFIGGI